MTYEYLQHMTSGDLFAVELDKDSHVVASYGPVAFSDASESPADYDLTGEDNGWFAEEDLRAGDAGAWRLVTDMEILQFRNERD